jgi:O-phospho-L-seryl-tRNASec:L-selenocysteinyl-tRNA synthase
MYVYVCVCVCAAGYELVVVPNVVEGDAVRTQVAWMADFVATHGAASVAAIVTTTACFAPRVPDRSA